MHRRAVVVWVVAVLLAGCATERGIPSHGGGKRFSEEQRVVSGAVRQAVADMDLAELRGRRVDVVMTNVPTSGGGNIDFGGIQNLNANGGWSDTFEDVLRFFWPQPRPAGWASNYRETKSRTGDRRGFGIGYRPKPRFNQHRFNTDGDVGYLAASLEMKGHHEGITITGDEPEAVLYVLVDVLGTNRSRADHLVVHRHDLTASCELSYYALDAGSGEMIFPCRRSSADGTYRETRFLPLLPLPNRVDRTIATSEPTAMPHAAADVDPGAMQPIRNGLHETEDPSDPQRRRLRALADQIRREIGKGRIDEAEHLLDEMRLVDPGYGEIEILKDEILSAE